MPLKSKKGKSPHRKKRTSTRIKAKSRKQIDHEEYISYDDAEGPSDIVLSCNSNAIKESIKGWIPDNCKCSLCKDYIQGVGYVNIIE